MDNLPISAAGALWSPIVFDPEHYVRLRSLIPKRKNLALAEYVMEPFSAEEILAQDRCQNCKQKPHEKFMDADDRENRTLPEDEEEENGHEEPKGETFTTKHKVLVIGNPPSQQRKPGEEEGPFSEPSKNPNVDTIMNIGKKRDGLPHYTSTFSCCRGGPSSPGCLSSEHHMPMLYPPHMTLFDIWTYHPTPVHVSMQKRFAVALDCGMGQSFIGENEIIRVSLIDYFTGEILIDSLVLPMNEITDYRTPSSGVTETDMNDAVIAAKFINGRETALRMIWNYVGPQTVVVVHGGANDLRDLKWIHGDIVDSANFPWPRRWNPKVDIQRRNDARTGGSKPSGTAEQPRNDERTRRDGKFNVSRWRLKHLSKKFVGKNIQQNDVPYSLEDAFACRELVNWWVMNGAPYESEPE
ncbi:hypothetical protein RUND412_006421 [Rhizina undulata]